VGYSDGKMEARERTDSLEAIHRVRGDGAAFRGYFWPAASTCSVEAQSYGGDGVGTRYRGVRERRQVCGEG